MSFVQAAYLPELPRVYVDTDYSTPTGTTTSVSSLSALQTAITAAQPGDIISLALGSYSGTLTLPAKSGSSYIYIVSASLNSLPPPGTRVSPADAGFMPKITSPGSNASAVNTQASAHHFRFVGIEFTCPSGDSQSGLIRFGTGAETNLLQFPEYLILDRCIVHGDPVTGGIRGVILAGNYLGIVDSYLYDWKKTDAQCQAVAGWTGEGPWSIKNCYLEADAENFMCGGSDPGITDLVPADIEFIGNLCSKPLTWNPFHASFAGVYYNVANLFELKMGRRVLCIENTFTNNWRSVQAGRAIVITTKNQGGFAPWTVIEDVSFLNNVIDGVHSAFSISGNDGVQPSAGGQRIRIHNNFIHDVGGNAWGEDISNPSTIFNMSGGMRYVSIQHNTIIRTLPSPNVDGLMMTVSGGELYEDFRFLDNICDHNTYGIKGPSFGIGNQTLASWFPACIFQRNVLYGSPGNAGNYPAGNYFPTAKADVGFINPDSDYRLDSTTTPLSDLSTGLTSFHDLSDANDSVGTSHLTAVGSPVFAQNGVTLVNASGQYLGISDNVAMSTGDINWTFNIWIAASNLAVASGFPFIACKGWLSDNNVNQEWGIAQNGIVSGVNQPLVFAVGFGTSTASIINIHGGALTVGNLYMVTVWHSATSNEIGICLNGDPAKTDIGAHSGGCNNGSRPFAIGARSDGSLSFDGGVAKAAFYKRVLTPAQITDLYHEGVRLTLAQMQAGEISVCPYIDVATDEGPIGAPDSVIETL